MLKGKTMEEIVNRWSSDLETQTREFTRIAGEVSVWDRMLVENGAQVSCWYTDHLVRLLIADIPDHQLDDCRGRR
jgi:nuclear pore complex protein Nup62